MLCSLIIANVLIHGYLPVGVVTGGCRLRVAVMKHQVSLLVCDSVVDRLATCIRCAQLLTVCPGHNALAGLGASALVKVLYQRVHCGS